MDFDRILLLGGTGFVGSALCEKLVTHFGGGGASIVVPSRRPQRARHLLTLPGVQVVEADVHDPPTLQRLLVGRNAVVNLIAILHGGAADFERVHVTLPRHLAGACALAGIPRVLHVSALGVAPDAPSLYLRSKAAGEAALRDAPLALTLLRPSVIFGAGDRFLNLFAKLQRVFPVLPLAGADARFQPVWVDDVAEALVRCIAEPSTAGATFECAGPKVYTLARLVELAGQWSRGRARAVLPLPDALGRLQARLMGLLPGEPLMSVDNLDSMRVPNVATGNLPGLAALGIDAAALEAIGPTYLGQGLVGTGRLEHIRLMRRP